MSTTIRRTTTALKLVLAVAFGLAAFIPAITHDAPEGDYQAMGPAAYQRFVESRNLDQPSNVPAWSWVTEDFPSCTGEIGLADSVVVVDSGADAHRLPFDRAWDLNHDDERANDVWVVGTC